MGFLFVADALADLWQLIVRCQDPDQYFATTLAAVVAEPLAQQPENVMASAKQCPALHQQEQFQQRLHH